VPVGVRHDTTVDLRETVALILTHKGMYSDDRLDRILVRVNHELSALACVTFDDLTLAMERAFFYELAHRRTKPCLD
jgi:hypothetical protein